MRHVTKNKNHVGYQPITHLASYDTEYSANKNASFYKDKKKTIWIILSVTFGNNHNNRIPPNSADNRSSMLPTQSKVLILTKHSLTYNTTWKQRIRSQFQKQHSKRTIDWQLTQSHHYYYKDKRKTIQIILSVAFGNNHNNHIYIPPNSTAGHQCYQHTPSF